MSAISPVVQREKCVSVLYIPTCVPRMCVCVCGIAQIHRGKERVERREGGGEYE